MRPVCWRRPSGFMGWLASPSSVLELSVRVFCLSHIPLVGDGEIIVSVLHAFELCREQTIPEINSQARLYRHVKTGAEVLVLANDDENKTFGVNFRTLPTDHTGVAHIVEDRKSVV